MGLSFISTRRNNPTLLISSPLQIYKKELFDYGLVFGKMGWQLMRWSFFLLLIKMLMQLLGSFQYTATLVTNNTYLTIGFLHLVFLGVVTIALFALLENAKLLHLNKT